MKTGNDEMRILCTVLGRIGDMILATPLFELIKDKFEDSILHIIAGRHNYIVIENNPRIDKIFKWNKSPFKILNTIGKIRESYYDYYIDPKDHFSKESNYIARLVKAKTKIGFNSHRKSIFDISIQGNDENLGVHFTDRCINPLKRIGITVPEHTAKPKLYISKDSEAYVNDFIQSNKIGKYIVINISASNKSKQWEVEKWIALINEIEDGSFKIVLSYAPPEIAESQEIIGKCRQIIPFHSHSIKDTISLVEQSNILITPDTSLVHIASAFNVPLIGLYSGLDEFYSKFEPLSRIKQIIRAEKGIDNIKGIEAIEVIKAYQKIQHEI